MQRLKTLLATHATLLSRLAALAGIVVYTLQSWYYIHHLDSVLDEGAYLLKGLLFVRGVFTPFQDYGPLTNHTPLGFLIPGVIQVLFGPGLRPARYFVLFVGILILIGLWLLVRRLRGEGWAAFAIWVLALNTAVIKMYSVATSQVLIACMLVWMFVCILGEDRKSWQLAVGGALAGVAMMTRINLAAVFPIIVLYIGGQYGRKNAILSALSGGVVILIGHLAYWPDILKLWTYWLPDALTPFLDPWREPEAVRYWNPTTDFNGRVISFFYGFRYHFVVLWSALTAWLLWPRRNAWKSASDFRMAVLLSALLLVLGAMHAVASLGLNYCIFCHSIYLSFFDFIGLLLFLVMLPSLTLKVHPFRQTLLAVLLIFLTTGIAYSAFSDFKDWGEDILKENVPRVANFQILPGTVKLWVLLENRFGWPYETQWRNFIPVMGVAIGLGILILSILIFLVRTLRKSQPQVSPVIYLTSITLLAGMLLAPTKMLGDGFDTYDCGQSETELTPTDDTPLASSSLDVIQSYEAAGHHLADLIPAGAQVYWRGTLSAVPLLYLDNPQLFPSQINQDYTLYLTGDDAELERFSFWSDTLAQKWVQEADYVLVSKRYFKDWLAETLSDPTQFEERTPTAPVAPCDSRSVIHIFARIDKLP
ncbi:MAG: hypothetical protein Fur0022_33270 [Anaerolineales bacterium]